MFTTSLLGEAAMTTEPAVKTSEASRMAGLRPHLQPGGGIGVIGGDFLLLSHESSHKCEDEGEGHRHGSDQSQP